MKAVMYGGGNIGRGFIGPLYRDSGYEVAFIDVAETLINALNARGEYPLRIVSRTGYEDRAVKGVSMINGNDREAVACAVAGADSMATAVGVNVLPYIAPNLAQGIRRRFAVTEKPLDIIICENLLNADALLADMIKKYLSDGERVLFEKRIGLVEASVGRMVPIQTEEMRDGDPLRLCVEAYGWLPVDRDSFKGTIPDIKGLVPYSPFDFYIKRKLYIHNMGHAVCAYAGLYLGIEYIWAAIETPDIRLLVQNAMLESARALSLRYNFPLNNIMAHIEDLLYRFGNNALADTCRRVGADPARKLSAADRLIGAGSLCLEQGVTPVSIAAGAAAGLYRYLAELKRPQTEANAARALEDVSGIKPGGELASEILRLYELYRRGRSIADIRRETEIMRAETYCGAVSEISAPPLSITAN
ncbi:MAG: mannitol-1-phosphate 5-dehydrogenase [Spirochaetaceae bacterium]|jgi:mannitol-1-phosphate 5-dehydrogenase|nr:mannitol-1-phosphate 5-dehydrogenase [Spirochaetaceae bacterium]